MAHFDDPNTLEEFLEWVRVWRVKIVEPPSQSPAFDMTKLVAYRRERFLIHLNKLLAPELLSEFYSEFDVDQCVSASDVVRMMLKAELLIQEEVPQSLDSTPGSRRKMYDRDHLWLQWYEDENSETHRRPAKIRDRWNRENRRESIGEGKHGIDTVKKALKKAREERNQEGNSEIPPTGERGKN